MYLTANKELRDKLYSNRIPLWEIAEEIGKTEGTVIRWLRAELPEDKKALIEAAISAILEKRGAADE